MRAGGYRVGVPVLAAACLAGAAGCEPEMARTAVFVEVFHEPEAPLPDRLLVTWLDTQQVLLRDQAVPSTGTLDPGREPLVTLAFEIATPGTDLQRRLLLLGMRGDAVVCRGYERITIQPRAWVTRAVSLTAELPADGDSDGMPDAIDNCRGSDFAGCPAPAQAP
jgi:hypothetical protein